jgi:hypothetical protein
MKQVMLGLAAVAALSLAALTPDMAAANTKHHHNHDWDRGSGFSLYVGPRNPYDYGYNRRYSYGDEPYSYRYRSDRYDWD